MSHNSVLSINPDGYFSPLRRLLHGADAGGAKTLGNGLAAFHYLHFLDIDVPTAASRLARPRSIVTELRAAATTLTLRHDEAPLPNLLSAHGACGARLDSLVTQFK